MATSLAFSFKHKRGINFVNENEIVIIDITKDKIYLKKENNIVFEFEASSLNDITVYSSGQENILKLFLEDKEIELFPLNNNLNLAKEIQNILADMKQNGDEGYKRAIKKIENRSNFFIKSCLGCVSTIVIVFFLMALLGIILSSGNKSETPEVYTPSESELQQAYDKKANELEPDIKKIFERTNTTSHICIFYIDPSLWYSFSNEKKRDLFESSAMYCKYKTHNKETNTAQLYTYSEIKSSIDRDSLATYGINGFKLK